jgi:4-hydroxy 2-oxovalerate aldolase
MTPPDCTAIPTRYESIPGGDRAHGGVSPWEQSQQKSEEIMSGTLEAALTQPFLIDVTLRDGGYVNGHAWSLRDAASIVEAVDASGVSFIEVGYLREREPDVRRPAASCPDDYLDCVWRAVTGAGLVVMVHPKDVSLVRLRELRDRGVSMVRMIVPHSDPYLVADYVGEAKRVGLLVSTNLTRVSEHDAVALAKSARKCEEMGADIVYLADSNGSLFPDDVRAKISAVAASCEIPVGFHAHDNLRMAFINACTAVDAGATGIDASLGGIGKGGGNLRLELVVAHWIKTQLPTLRIDPLVRNAATLAAQLRMLAEGDASSLLSGVLDVNLDGAAAFEHELASRGGDALLRDRSFATRRHPIHRRHAVRSMPSVSEQPHSKNR